MDDEAKPARVAGFTGTRDGMTDAQRAALGTLLIFDIKPYEFHHGSCQGADVEAAQLVRYVNAKCKIVCHPGPVGDRRQEDSCVDDERHPNKAFLVRNRDIVDACDVLIVCPKDMEHQTKGGTWYTHDYAVRKGKPVVVVLPNGDINER